MLEAAAAPAARALCAPCRRMEGAGNRFVLVDARACAGVDDATLAAFARRAGSGGWDGEPCDQLILLTREADAAVRFRVRNADGAPAEACGNAARCVGALLARETGADATTILSDAGAMRARLIAENKDGAGGAEAQVAVSLPGLTFDWRAIGLARPHKALAPIETPYGLGYAAGIGNPHLVLSRDEADAKALEALRDAHGPTLERLDWFPNRVNVGFIHVASPGRIVARVWERGAGATAACGTAACAAVAVAHKLGRARMRGVEVAMPGGTLRVDLGAGEATLTGPARVGEARATRLG